MTSKPEHLYLELMKKTLSFTLWPEPPIPLEVFNDQRTFLKRMGVAGISRMLRAMQLQIVKLTGFSKEDREAGRIWPGLADTMIGLKRLDNIQMCVETAVHEGVAGDLIETGVWRGGACIFMRAVLAVLGVEDRTVFVADSFAGLPKPEADKYPADTGDEHHAHRYLAVSQEQVEKNFERYGLLDEKVVFLKGWFEDTLPDAPIKNLAVMRLDGDMYGSTMVALKNLYPKLSSGGFCIIDDYALDGCRKAVDDFRAAEGIRSEMSSVDWTCRCWRKE